MLQDELQYYIEHQADFVSKYRGKFLVIKNKQIIGVYDDEMEAYRETQEKHELGTFLIQVCLPGEGNYTQTFHSRVIFT